MKLLSLYPIFFAFFFLTRTELHAESTVPNLVVPINCAQLLVLTGEELSRPLDEFMAKHNTKYTIEVETTPIRNQCRYGSCWSYSEVAGLETEYLRRTGKQINLSEQFVVYQDLLKQADDALNNPEEAFSPGSNVAHAHWVIKDKGILPVELWNPRIDFERDGNGSRMLYYLNSIVASYQIERTKPDRKGEILELRKIAQSNLQKVFDFYFGEPPGAFEYQGKKYSGPKEFAEHNFPSLQRLMMSYSPKRKGIPDKLANEIGKAPENFGDSQKEKEEDFVAFENRIIDSLKAGIPVAMGFEDERLFMDKKTGIFSIAAFAKPEGLSVTPFQYRRAFGLNAGGHAVEIVGVDLDSSGRPIKFKIKNSWGTKSGDHGYYHMYHDYFREYVKKIYLIK